MLRTFRYPPRRHATPDIVKNVKLGQKLRRLDEIVIGEPKPETSRTHRQTMIVGVATIVAVLAVIAATGRCEYVALLAANARQPALFPGLFVGERWASNAHAQQR